MSNQSQNVEAPALSTLGLMYYNGVYVSPHSIDLIEKMRPTLYKEVEDLRANSLLIWKDQNGKEYSINSVSFYYLPTVTSRPLAIAATKDYDVVPVEAVEKGPKGKEPIKGLFMVTPM